MRQANIYYKDIATGILTETDAGYEFRYFPEYLASDNAKAVSLTLPLRQESYTCPVLFPFFDGLIPEGWLLDVALRNTDISLPNSGDSRHEGPQHLNQMQDVDFQSAA